MDRKNKNNTVSCTLLITRETLFNIEYKTFYSKLNKKLWKIIPKKC